jgi:hypothetical protein
LTKRFLSRDRRYWDRNELYSVEYNKTGCLNGLNLKRDFGVVYQFNVADVLKTIAAGQQLRLIHCEFCFAATAADDHWDVFRTGFVG